MRDRLDGDQPVGFGVLSLVVTLDPRVVAHREIHRLHIGPSQTLITVFGVTTSLGLTIACPLAAHAAAIGGIVANLAKTVDVSGFECDRRSKDHAYAADFGQTLILGA